MIQPRCPPWKTLPKKCFRWVGCAFFLHVSMFLSLMSLVLICSSVAFQTHFAAQFSVWQKGFWKMFDWNSQKRRQPLQMLLVKTPESNRADCMVCVSFSAKFLHMLSPCCVSLSLYSHPFNEQQEGLSPSFWNEQWGAEHREQQLGCYQREDWAPGKTHRSWRSNVSWGLVFPSLALESPWLTAAAGVLPVDGHPDVWPKFMQLCTLHRYHNVRQLFVGRTEAFFSLQQMTLFGLFFSLLRSVNDLDVRTPEQRRFSCHNKEAAKWEMTASFVCLWPSLLNQKNKVVLQYLLPPDGFCKEPAHFVKPVP